MVSAWLRRLAPFTFILPNVEKAPSSVKYAEKCFYTFMALLVYLLASQIPLYGLHSSITNDPLYWLRSIFASQRGSLMELGVGPAMTSGLILKLLISAHVLPLDKANKEETEVFTKVQNLLGSIFTLFQAILYVVSGMYGPASALGLFNCILIIAQLTCASVMVQTLDQMLESGWGVGSGVSLFTTANVCEAVLWKSFSFLKIDRGYGDEYEGAIVAMFHYLFTLPNKLTALKLALFRTGLPNMMNIIATFVIFALVIYLQSIKRNVKIQHAKAGASIQQQFPVKLLYASSTPLMLISAATSNVFMISQALWRRFGNHFLTSFLGTWREMENRPGQAYPTGGLAWILAPPYSLFSAIYHPVHTILHSAVVIVLSGVAAKMWIGFSGEGPKDVADMLEGQGWIIPGSLSKGAMQRELTRLIPVAALTGGLILGGLGIVADIFGALGGGTGILLAATTLVKMYEDFAKEGMDIML